MKQLVLLDKVEGRLSSNCLCNSRRISFINDWPGVLLDLDGESIYTEWYYASHEIQLLKQRG